MTANTLEVSISPDIMKWVIDTSGREIAEIAKRLDVTESAVRGWTRKSHKISVAKLENLSKYVKRPLAVFLLKNPPEQPEVHDYRRLSTSNPKITHKAALAIRLAHYLQEAAGDMMRLNGEGVSPDVRPGVTVRHSSKKIATKERGGLNLDALERAAEPGDRARRFYNILRGAVESCNILVFQQSAEIEEMRGLSISDRHPCVILINSKDSLAARRFTLMHEYGHILLKKGGLCVPQTPSKSTASTIQGVEAWCNRFAAFVLMPEVEFRKEYGDMKSAGTDDVEIVSRLSHRFATSRLSVAIHAVDLGLGTPSMVKNARKHTDAPRTTGRGPKPPVKCISERGRKFVSLVLESRQSQAISSRDATYYLGTDLKHTKALEDMLY